MTLFDELKSLIGCGTAAPIPAVVPPPEPAATPVVTPESAPSVTAIAPEPAVDLTLPAAALDEYGENPERPVTPAEEADETLPVRSRQRIAFLLRTYEAGDISRTLARIANDKARFANAHPQVEQPVRYKVVDHNPQSHLV